jgi:hypothetical protein
MLWRLLPEVFLNYGKGIFILERQPVPVLASEHYLSK